MESNTDNITVEENVKAKILRAYHRHVLLHGTEPASVFAFCQDLEIEESEFYEYFNSFEQVEDSIWQALFEKVLSQIESDKDYVELSSRDKLLTFYYEFFQMMKEHRSYAMIRLEDPIAALGKTPKGLGQLKKDYKHWINGIISDGMHTEEVAGRSKLSESYDSLFWFQFLFLLNFWKRDKSKGFEKTDAAIEKSVNLSFDLIAKNALDSAFDFGKFLFQNL